MDWLAAAVIVVGNTVTVLLVQLFGNRKREAETQLSLVQAQHVLLEDFQGAYERGQRQLKEKERQVEGLRGVITALMGTTDP